MAYRSLSYNRIESKEIYQFLRNVSNYLRLIKVMEFRQGIAGDAGFDGPENHEILATEGPTTSNLRLDLPSLSVQQLGRSSILHNWFFVC
jgi:hypothetical protein